MEADGSAEEHDGVGGVPEVSARTSVATRLAVSALVVAVVSLLAATAVATSGTDRGASSLLHGRLDAVGQARAAEVEATFNRASNQVIAMAVSATVSDALVAFSDAYADLRDLEPVDVRDATDRLGAFYFEEFLPALEERRGVPVDPLGLFGASRAAIYLQDAYIASNPLGLGEKGLLADARDDSRWTEVHRTLHPTFRGAIDRLGFVDLYLVEQGTDTIVYSARKDIEFATSLDTGPHSDTQLARLVDIVSTRGEAGEVYAADYSLYLPGLDEPSFFLASAVFDGDQRLGVVAVRLSTDTINDITTRDWRFGRLGDTGESYLVGSDGLMRTDARMFLEDPAGFEDAALAAGTASAEEVDRVLAMGSTVLLQEVSSPSATSGLTESVGFAEEVNYLGLEVYTSAVPIDAAGIRMSLVTEQSRSEVDAPLTNVMRDSSIIAALFVVGLTFLIVIWSNSFVGPVRGISASLKRIRAGDLDVTVPVEGAREFRQLADDVNGMIGDLAARERQIDEATAEKIEMLERVLPPAAAQSVGLGDRRLVETVPVATVAVAALTGLEDLTRAGSVELTRDLVHAVVDDADALAELEGLERIKVVGDTYYAVCGLSTPYLDHAPRAVRFCDALRAAVQRLAAANDAEIDLAAGVHSGPVTVGLVGDARLVYDMWGETTGVAHDLARRAAPGEIMVSEIVARWLPEGQATRRAAGGLGEDVWVVDELPTEVGR